MIGFPACSDGAATRSIAADKPTVAHRSPLPCVRLYADGVVLYAYVKRKFLLQHQRRLTVDRLGRDGPDVTAIDEPVTLVVRIGASDGVFGRCVGIGENPRIIYLNQLGGGVRAGPIANGVGGLGPAERIAGFDPESMRGESLLDLAVAPVPADQLVLFVIAIDILPIAAAGEGGIDVAGAGRSVIYGEDAVVGAVDAGFVVQKIEREKRGRGRVRAVVGERGDVDAASGE